MSVLFAERLYTASGWLKNVRIHLDGGLVAKTQSDEVAQPGDESHAVILPAMPNLHSHAFQHAMAGLVERRGPGEDSFWSWRTLMYRFALSMTPDQIEAVAARLYMQMLEGGFGRVGEFHYLHHDRSGEEYSNVAEHCERIAAAAATSGIRMTLLPVFYAHSGFGGAAPADGQKRFITNVDSFSRLLAGAQAAVSSLEGAVVGVAPHSLRAVTPDELATVAGLLPAGPVHIHVSEQIREVEDCIAWCGKRPIEWLLANQNIDDRWCLIHATHMTASETAGMARCGAVAGLCPITEANLGDGIFPARPFLAAGGSFGIGSDSNVLISVPEELRQFEYSERLAERARNVIAAPGGSTGRRLFQGALDGGGRALGSAPGIAAGQPADLVSLNIDAAPYCDGDSVLDHWIFARGIMVDSVWISGRKLVEDGRHKDRDRIEQRFQRTMKEMLNS